MDNQSNPNNSLPEQQPIAPLEQLPSLGLPEQTPQPVVPEYTPPVASELPSASTVQNAGQPPVPQLTAADVAAAIAAAPMPTAPVIPVPQVALDQDSIEPEWIDAVDKTIEQTAGNPYAEEEAVENLQIDYMKKRYGKDIKKSE